VPRNIASSLRKLRYPAHLLGPIDLDVDEADDRHGAGLSAAYVIAQYPTKQSWGLP